MPSPTTASARFAAFRAPAALVASGLVAFGIVTVPASSAAAAATTLCSSYSSCAAAGLTDRGYASMGGASYWGMYAGHDCTNYVAYTLTMEGVARPAYRLGNAADWGPAARAAGVAVDAVPAVGAVAWWSSGAGGVSPAGHVAVVERADGSSITVSEDNYPAGPFRWRVIAAGSPGWPTGFIHFGNAAGAWQAPAAGWTVSVASSLNPALTPSVAGSTAGETAVAAVRTDGGIVLATRGGRDATWTTSTVAPAGSAFSAPGLVLGPRGLAEIAVRGRDGSLAVYGRSSSASTWTVETVAGPATTAGAPAAVLTTAGRLQIATRGPRGNLNVYSAVVSPGPTATGSATAPARPAVRTWTTTEVGGAGAAQGRPAATLDPTGTMRIAVVGAGHTLALYSGRPGGTWTAGTVAAAGSAFSAPSIVAGAGGRLEVSSLAKNGTLEVWDSPATLPTGPVVASPSTWPVQPLSGPGIAGSAPVLVPARHGVAAAVVVGRDGGLALYSATPGAAARGLTAGALLSTEIVGGAGAASSAVAAVATPDGPVDIVAITAAGTLDIYRRSGGGAWTVTSPQD